MEPLYFVGVIVIVLLLIKLSKEKKFNQLLSNRIEVLQKEHSETSATLEIQYADFNKEKRNLYSREQVEKTVTTLENNHIKDKQKIIIEHQNEKQKLIVTHQEEINKLKKYIHSIEKQSRNFGEIKTHNILNNLKEVMITKKIIHPSQMIIMPNVFVPLEDNSGEIVTRQIDHLVITTRGVFVIETKYWKGTILYGLSKNKAKEFSFILDSLYPGINTNSEKTVVFTNGNEISENSKELKVVSYEDPAHQARTTAYHLNQLLRKFNENVFITPIIFFGYLEKTFINFSTNNNPYVFDQKDSLCDFFYQLYSEESQKEYSVEQIEKIRGIIEELNYLK